MAGKHLSGVTPRTRSRFLLFLLSLLPISLLFYAISVFSSPSTSLPIHASQIAISNADYSFVASLEKFLAQTSRTVSDDTVTSVQEKDVKKLDDVMWKTETTRLYGDSFFTPLRVYVYEMPSKFTYDLLVLFQSTYRETSNLTSNGSPVHRLIEQAWLLYIYWVHLLVIISLLLTVWLGTQ